MKLLLYCTKAKPYITQGNDGSVYPSCAISDGIQEWHLNGKIVAECDFEVEKIFEDNYEDDRDGYIEHFYTLESCDDFDEGQEVLLKESCLQKHELSNYLGFENGYAIHIKNLHIFDEPKELSDYKIIRDNGCSRLTLTKAPQNMMKVKEFKNGMVADYILISIRPEWLCKILNGEKTIEVRKKVLKEMLKNV